jgi:hypothetical protein
MVSKFFQRTVLGHLAFVGIGYIVLRIVWLFVLLTYAPPDRGFPPPPAPLVFLVTLAAAIYYSHCLRKYRPVPHNPIQQFHINLIIATYAIVLALSLAIPFCASLTGERDGTLWPLPAALYVFFAWRHVYGVDPATLRDAHHRQMSEWERAIFEKKKNQSRFRRSELRWRY